MDPAFHVSVMSLKQAQDKKKAQAEDDHWKKTASLREEYDLLNDGIWRLRSILLESDDLTESMNNKFVMQAKQKWLRDLLLMLDLCLVDSVKSMIKDYRKSYKELRCSLLSIRRVRGTQRECSNITCSPELQRRLDEFDECLFRLWLLFNCFFCTY